MKAKEKLKLNCPMCNTEFITERRDKIWCEISCSNNYQKICKKIKENHSKQKMMISELYLYDLDKNKFYMESFKNRNNETN